MILKEGNLLAEALNQYSFQHPQVKMIRHNENQTYQVIDGQNQYLLRIHLPIDGFSVEEKLKQFLTHPHRRFLGTHGTHRNTSFFRCVPKQKA